MTEEELGGGWKEGERTDGVRVPKTLIRGQPVVETLDVSLVSLL